YERERVFARNPHTAVYITFRESRILHQPSRRNFLLFRQCWIIRHLQVSVLGSSRKGFKLLRRKHRILEERSGTLAIRIAGRDQHAFAGAYFQDSFTNFSKSRGFIASCKILL